MRMKLTIRKRYLRFLLPMLAALLLLAFFLLWIGGFGFRYLLRKPAELASVPPEELPGSYVTLSVKDAGDPFTYLGYQEDDGTPVITEEYTACRLNGKYLIVRVTKKDVATLERYLNAAELVQSGELGSVLEANLGKLTGTVNKLKKDPEKQLRSWLTSHQIDSRSLKDLYSGTDVSAWPGAAEGNYDAYLDDVILPYELDAGCLGVRSAGTVRFLTVLAAILVLLAAALLVSIFLGLWEKNMRAAIRQQGKRLFTDYDSSELFGAGLRVGRDFVWVFGTLFTRILENKDIVWAYPRSKRLEGGKLRWSLVLKTDTGAEAVARLDSEAAVEQAIGCLLSQGFPMAVGFDKEKQKLYKKDLAAFRSRARSGSF